MSKFLGLKKNKCKFMNEIALKPNFKYMRFMQYPYIKTIYFIFIGIFLATVSIGSSLEQITKNLTSQNKTFFSTPTKIKTTDARITSNELSHWDKVAYD